MFSSKTVGLWLSRGLTTALLTLVAAPASAATVRCESVGGRSASCDLPGSDGVVLERQLGGARCDYGRNWFWDGRRVRVEENCRGEFRNALDEFELGQSLFCAGRHGRLKRCAADTRSGALLEAGEDGCVLDHTWGFDAQGVWVDDRCEVSARVAVGAFQGRPIRCDWIEDGPRRFCPLDTRGGVVLERSIGTSACLFDATWGLAEGGVWVDRGCSALFRADSMATSGALGAPPVELACAASGAAAEFCAAGGTLTARLVTDASDGRCVEGLGWRATAHGIFVADGCVGLFEITH